MVAKVSMMLVDNGSTLNVCPFRIAFKVGLDMETIIPSPLIVKAYDNTLSKVMATFKAACKVVPLDSIMDFQVMDITPSYNHFLGRD